MSDDTEYTEPDEDPEYEDVEWDDDEQQDQEEDE